MSESISWREPLLFTPGPLTTSLAVKEAMLKDFGARDENFLSIVLDIRNRLLKLADVTGGEYESILMQGCGSMGVEATIGTAIPRDGSLLAIVNGAYGQRIFVMAKTLGINVVVLEYPENKRAVPEDVNGSLSDHPEITHVAVVHCETTSGLFNPIKEIGEIVAKHKRSYIVDAMSSFAAVPVNMKQWGIDWLVSSANKCIEGVPGFSFVIANAKALASCKGNSRSLCLDLFAQHIDMQKNGQFRYTPPTHAILAFHKALLELEAEGGPDARMRRYQENCATLRNNMAEIGFKEFLAPDDHGWIITSFRYPEHPNFSFDVFYERLKKEGFVIYPGKVGNAELFRIGNIGRLRKQDIANLTSAIQRTLKNMKIDKVCDIRK